MVRARLLPVLVLASATACSGRATTSSLPPTPTPAPGGISVRVAGVLQYPGDSATATATQGTAGGPFTYVSTNAKVLGLSAKPPSPGAKYPARLVSPSGLVYIVATGTGTASITVMGSAGAIARPRALQNVVIVAPPKVVVAPVSLSFDGTGPSRTVKVDVTQDDYGGSFTLTNPCAGVATISVVSNAHGAAQYNVTPVGKGSCAFSFAGAYEQTSTLPVGVAPAKPVVVSPSRMRFTSLAPKTVHVSQAGYEGAFEETDGCAGIAPIVQTSAAPGAATYRVTPLKNGSCFATFTGGGGRQGVLEIDISIAGVIVNPKSLQFTTSGSAQDVAVSQSHYSGAFTVDAGCNSRATITPTHNGGGTATFAVVAQRNGQCTATFEGGNGETGRLNVAIALPGPVHVSPASLTFSSTGPGSARTVNVTQPGFTGSFAISDDCAGIATIVAATAPQYIVTPVGGGDCTAVFTGANGEFGVLTISVSLPGDVVAVPAPLNFGAVGAANAQNVAVTQAGFSGSFGESDTCAGIATVVAVTNTGGSAVFLVTPVTAGLCDITFTGNGGATFVDGVSVTETGFGVQIVHARGRKVKP